MLDWDRKPMAPPDTAYSLWYYPEINRFTDGNGYILHNLSNLFAVWQLEEWKKTQEYDILKDRNGEWCELYYLVDDDE